MNPVIKVVIAEPSLIIRKWLLSVLKKLSTLHIETAEVADMQQLMTSLSWHRPDILIVNPGVAGVVSLAQIKKGSEGAVPKCVALQNSLVDLSILKMYDEVISVYDSAEQIKEKFDKRCFFTPKKMGAQTAEANINAGIAAAKQSVGYLKNGIDKFRVNK